MGQARCQGVPEWSWARLVGSSQVRGCADLVEKHSERQRKRARETASNDWGKQHGDDRPARSPGAERRRGQGACQDLLVTSEHFSCRRARGNGVQTTLTRVELELRAVLR